MIRADVIRAHDFELREIPDWRGCLYSLNHPRQTAQRFISGGSYRRIDNGPGAFDDQERTVPVSAFPIIRGIGALDRPEAALEGDATVYTIGALSAAGPSRATVGVSSLNRLPVSM